METVPSDYLTRHRNQGDGPIPNLGKCGWFKTSRLGLALQLLFGRPVIYGATFINTVGLIIPKDKPIQARNIKFILTKNADVSGFLLYSEEEMREL